MSLITSHLHNVITETRFNRENKIGPRIEPWGTPQVKRIELDENVSISTEKLLFVRYDANQFNPVSQMPTQRFNLFNRVQ